MLEAEREARERQLQQVSDQLEFGEATRLDLLQAQVALANLRPEVLSADNAIRVALMRLNETLGRDPRRSRRRERWIPEHCPIFRRLRICSVWLASNDQSSDASR